MITVKMYNNIIVYLGIDKTGQDFFQFAWLNTSSSVIFYKLISVTSDNFNSTFLEIKHMDGQFYEKIKYQY